MGTKFTRRSFAISSFAALAPREGVGADDASVYLFSYFRNNGETGLDLASSSDGLRWTELNGGQPLLAPSVGESKLMRDPSLVYVARENKDFAIVWSSTIRGRFPETLGQGTRDYNHRMYVTHTRDFKAFTAAKVLFDPGFQTIDGAIFGWNKGYAMVAKNETQTPPAKYLFTATASRVDGPWSAPSKPITGPEWAEGPSPLLLDGGGLIVYFDKYRDKKWGAIRASRDLSAWEDVSSQVQMPPGARHGTALRVPRKLVEAL